MVARYTTALAEIFAHVKAAGCELIFMTPNMMNTHLSPFLMKDADVIAIAEQTGRKQNGGMFDAHIEAARKLCRDMNVPLCDCYAIQGACFFASANKSLTLLAPTPTNISTKSEPEMLKNGTAASPAIAFARRVLPVPGGPSNKTPFGILAPTCVNLPGLFKN